ncbi:MAG: hypothetical protein ACLP7A_04275, partial [Desulfobaccales bacterium]
MAKLDDKTDKILERLSIEEKKKVINVMNMEIIKDMRPAVDDKIDMHYITSNRIILTIDIKNIGKYPITIKHKGYFILS